MKLLRLFGASFSLSLRQQLAFRVDLLFSLFVTATGIASGIAALGIVYARTETLGGWARGEAIVLLGTFQLLSIALNTFVAPNLQSFRGQLQSGALDDTLLKPAPALFLATVGRSNPLGLAHVGLALAAIVLGLRDVAVTPPAASVAAWLLLLVAGAVLMWAVRVLTACVTLWFPGVALDVVFGSLWQLARYPVSIYREPVTFLLTFVLPVAFISSAPALALTRGAGVDVLLASLVAVAVAVTVVQLVWTAGLKRYTSATS